MQTAVSKKGLTLLSLQVESNVLVSHPLQDSHLVQSTHAHALHVYPHCCIYGGSNVAFSHMVLSCPWAGLLSRQPDCNLGNSQGKS